MFYFEEINGNNARFKNASLMVQKRKSWSIKYWRCGKDRYSLRNCLMQETDENKETLTSERKLEREEQVNKNFWEATKAWNDRDNRKTVSHLRKNRSGSSHECTNIKKRLRRPFSSQTRSSVDREVKPELKNQANSWKIN